VARRRQPGEGCVARHDRVDDEPVLGRGLRGPAGRREREVAGLGEVRVEVGEQVVEQPDAARLGDREMEGDVERDQLVRRRLPFHRGRESGMCRDYRGHLGLVVVLDRGGGRQLVERTAHA